MSLIGSWIEGRASNQLKIDRRPSASTMASPWSGIVLHMELKSLMLLHSFSIVNVFIKRKNVSAVMLPATKDRISFAVQ